jgi:dCTP deaminase
MIGSERLKQLIASASNGSDSGLLIVPNPNDEAITSGGASIDLRLGRWFLSIQQSKTNVIDLGKEQSIDEFEAREARTYYVPFGEKFVVHPGRFVLASTLEWVRMPTNLGGMITGKSTVGRRGLVIETAAGLHPGFSGCITLELANCGEVPIALAPGMRICQIFFHEVVGGARENRTSVGGRRKPTFGPYKMDNLLKNIFQNNNTSLV